MNDMIFVSLKDFVQKCEGIKKLYKEFSTPFFNAKKVRFYKKYVYRHSMLEWQCDLIWRYLNDDIEEDLLYQITRVKK